jgi:hypothetical protein
MLEQAKKICVALLCTSLICQIKAIRHRMCQMFKRKSLRVPGHVTPLVRDRAWLGPLALALPRVGVRS